MNHEDRYKQLMAGRDHNGLVRCKAALADPGVSSGWWIWIDSGYSGWHWDSVATSRCCGDTCRGV